MIISALKEANPETRVAITPQVVNKYTRLGLKTLLEPEAGFAAGFKDETYKKEGVKFASKKELLEQTSILLAVDEPIPKVLKSLKKEALIIAPIDKDPKALLIKYALKENLSLFSMNLIPRISRAQNLDTLSSQANLAGYRAVIEAVSHYNRAIPMMMTAAGMIQPAKILILGAGVAGLQAIATAKRLGAVVYAFDVRAAAKEQVESLGAEFIEVNAEENLETSGGYAKEMTDDYKKQQAALIEDYAKMVDIIICTALIPGKKAPILITKKMVNQMKPNSVIVDLASGRGGNCELSEDGKIIVHHDIIIVGSSNMAGLIAATASELYANNLANLIPLIVSGSPLKLNFNHEDEIIKQALICHQGVFEPFMTKENHHA